MDKINDFKSVALQMGYDPQEVDAFTKVLSEQGDNTGKADSGLDSVGQELGYPQQDISTVDMISSAVPLSPRIDGENYSKVSPIDTLGDIKYEGTAIGEVPILTQPFGARNHRYDRISGGINRGADFGVKEGTPLFAPGGGKWVVLDAYNKARGRGMQNSGWGNSVLLQNTQTGEEIRMSHLSKVGVAPGDILNGGSPIGLSGSTGHATGPHVDVEYIKSNGKLSNVLNSPYAHQFL